MMQIRSRRCEHGFPHENILSQFLDGSLPLYSRNISVPSTKHKKQPWWCSGQHIRSSILSSYPLYLPALSKILKLSLEGRKAAGSNPAHGAHYPFCLCRVVVFVTFVGIETEHDYQEQEKQNPNTNPVDPTPS
jgi:hypothetical protein